MGEAVDSAVPLAAATLQANLPLDPQAAVQQAGGPVYLAYFWRGKHDLLWFKTDGSAVLEVDWWMAYE